MARKYLFSRETINANRDLWIAALESGEYKQATGVLKRPGVGYCCLGVVCEGLWPVWVDSGRVPAWGLAVDVWSARIALDPETYAALGITLFDANDLMRMNDCGASFTEIAAYIRKLPITMTPVG